MNWTIVENLLSKKFGVIILAGWALYDLATKPASNPLCIYAITGLVAIYTIGQVAIDWKYNADPPKPEPVKTQ